MAWGKIEPSAFVPLKGSLCTVVFLAKLSEPLLIQLRVVRKSVNANAGLRVNRRVSFCVALHLFVLQMKEKFSLILGYLNRALNNPVKVYKMVPANSRRHIFQSHQLKNRMVLQQF